MICLKSNDNRLIQLTILKLFWTQNIVSVVLIGHDNISIPVVRLVIGFFEEVRHKVDKEGEVVVVEAAEHKLNSP